MFAKRILAVALVAILANMAVVFADVAINFPIKGSSVTAGEPADITWIPGPNGVTGADVEIVLMEGTDQKNLRAVQSLGHAKDTDLKATVTIPSDLVTSSSYVIRVGNNYSHYFTVSGSASSSTPTSTSSSSSSSSSDSTSTTTITSTPTKNSVKMPSSATAISPNAQPLVFTGSLIALVPVAIMAIWGF
jgi:hypothetical protein